MANLCRTLICIFLLTVPIAVHAGQPFAVIELFTSEGCSSCPPADAFFKDLTAQARQNGTKIYTLGFHVGYWNYLGWADPFSRESFSDRQRAYANINKVKTVYTPQMVVNGQSAFSGTNFEVAQKAINLALNTVPAAELKLSRLNYDEKKHRLSFSYIVSGNTADAELKIAIVERDLISDVTKGENSGRRLRHDNTVRKFESKSLKGGSQGTVDILIPKEVDRAKASLVGFLQNSQTLVIIAADGFDL